MIDWQTVMGLGSQKFVVLNKDEGILKEILWIRFNSLCQDNILSLA